MQGVDTQDTVRIVLLGDRARLALQPSQTVVSCCEVTNAVGKDQYKPVARDGCWEVGGVCRAEEIVEFRRVVGSDWLEYIYNV